MMRLDIKPLSVNRCWKGKRFKTKEYKRYERDCLLILPKLKILEVAVVFKFIVKLLNINGM